jgi:hypothetical protein
MEKLATIFDPNWVFRGHGDKEHGLTTTLQLA